MVRRLSAFLLIAATGIVHASPINLDQSQMDPDYKNAYLTVQSAIGLYAIFSANRPLSRKGRALAARNEQMREELESITSKLEPDQNMELSEIQNELLEAKKTLATAEGAFTSLKLAKENARENYSNNHFDDIEYATGAVEEYKAKIVVLEARAEELKNHSAQVRIPEDQRTFLLERQRELTYAKSENEEALAKAISKKGFSVVRFSAGVFLCYDFTHTLLNIAMVGPDLNFKLVGLDAAARLYNYADQKLNNDKKEQK